MIPGLKSYGDDPGINDRFSFFLIYDKVSGLYSSGKAFLDTMNNAQVYRTPGSALEEVKKLRKQGGWTYIGTKPGSGGRKVECDPVAVLHSVAVKTLPTYTYEDLLEACRDLKKEGK